MDKKEVVEYIDVDGHSPFGKGNNCFIPTGTRYFYQYQTDWERRL